MIWAALLLGLGGSLHCAAMCGPLVFSVQTNWNIKGLSPHLLIYHLGRIAGYLLLGLAFSLVKVPVHLFDLQQYIALVSGILLLLFVFKHRIPGIKQMMSWISARLSKTMSQYYHKKNSLPFIGFLNGLLPCGLSYAAAAVSVSQPGMTEGLLFMFFFGIGTLPMFLIGSYLGKKLKFRFFQNINKYVNYSMILLGVLLVIRGSGLNIPYLSPDIAPETGEVECCH